MAKRKSKASDPLYGSFFKSDEEFQPIFQRYGPRLLEEQLLFHYTDSVGISGIVERQEFWATHHECTNDFREVQYGLDLFVKEIEERRKSQDDNREYSLDDYFEGRAGNANPSDVLLQLLKAMIDGKNRMIEFFIVCFSCNGDLLSQWRAYARDASGYSLGYSAINLAKLRDHLPPGEAMELLSVIYDESDQQKHIQEVLDKLVNLFDSATPRVIPKFRREWVASFNAQACKWLLATAVRLKHSGFHEEKEWRLVYPILIGQEQESAFRVMQRSSNGRLIPYVAIPVKVPIQEVWIGPKQAIQGPEKSTYPVKSLFQRKGMEPKIECSSTPYR